MWRHVVICKTFFFLINIPQICAHVRTRAESLWWWRVFVLIKNPGQKLIGSSVIVCLPSFSWLQQPASDPYWGYNSCVAGRADSCVLMSGTDTFLHFFSPHGCELTSKFSLRPIGVLAGIRSSPHVSLHHIVLWLWHKPAFLSRPCLHGDGVSIPLPGIGSLEFCSTLGLPPSLPLSRCQCVAHWKTVKSMTDTQQFVSRELYTWLPNRCSS